VGQVTVPIAVPAGAEAARTGLSANAIRRGFLDNLFFVQGRFQQVATPNDLYMALAYTVRDRLLDLWVRASEAYSRRESRTVVYLSAEYLPGPHLLSNLLALGILEEARAAMRELGHDLDVLAAVEEEPGLGNGGLGRLAACFMDSLATLRLPAIGYGLRYEFGIFDQEIRDGWQMEVSDRWLRNGNPWEIPRPEIAFDIGFGGSTEWVRDGTGRERVRWLPERQVRGVARDTAIPGYSVPNANLLRLWKGEACREFDLTAFNAGDYWRAVDDKVRSENISKVLYPNDEREAGRRLRLEQQYFLVACALADLVRIFRQRRADLRQFPDKYAIQLNDTHPTLAILELMRIFVDDEGFAWEEAWELVGDTFSYTNHTLLPEALERWPLALFASSLPRHLEIAYEINRRFLGEVAERYPGDLDRQRRLSLIDESGERSLRMAHLACVAVGAINGVARLHTDLLRRETLRDFAELWPQKFLAITNGVTPRRFLALANPGLAELLTATIGPGWLHDLERLRELERWAEDESFRARFLVVKRANKARLAADIAARAGVNVDPFALFDIQAKRIHEYKRQHLMALHAIALWRRLRRGEGEDWPARVLIFAGKAAPGYRLAKLIIRLVHGIAEVVNADGETRDRLRVVFLPDHNVKNAMSLFPAADLSEQISTAGYEASGTGNMKFAMNGALTIGTLDGANVEIREAVGAARFFLFGMTAEEVQARAAGDYQPRQLVERDPLLAEVFELLADGTFARGDRELYRPLLDNLLDHDRFFVLADFAAYAAAQARAAAAYQDVETWNRDAILTVARMGMFSSDRAIREYAEKVWHVEPVAVAEPAA
jgi:glycogen phosphorylase